MVLQFRVVLRDLVADDMVVVWTSHIEEFVEVIFNLEGELDQLALRFCIALEVAPLAALYASLLTV